MQLPFRTAPSDHRCSAARDEWPALSRPSGESMPKYVLCYSGGLDTSVMLKWLQETYGAEVITFTADLGQKQELEGVREKALATGASQVFIEDLRDEFVAEFVWPSLKAGALYQGVYPLATAFGRPLIARKGVGVARAGHA